MQTFSSLESLAIVAYNEKYILIKIPLGDDHSL